MDSHQLNPPDEIAQALAQLPLFVNVRQAADFLNVGPGTIREMVKRGELTAVRPEGRHMRIPRSSLAQYLEENTWHAQDKGQGSSAYPEKTIGTSRMEPSEGIRDAASNFRRELAIGRKLNAF